MDHGRSAVNEVAGSGARLMNAAGPNGFMVLVVGANLLVGAIVGMSWLLNAIRPVTDWLFRLPALWMGFPWATANTIYVVGPTFALVLFALPFAVWARAILKGRRYSKWSRTVARRNLAVCAAAAFLSAAHSGLPVLLVRGYTDPEAYPIRGMNVPVYLLRTPVKSNVQALH